MTVPYLTFTKHAEKVIKDVSEVRPALKGIYHGDSVVYVTDAFRLYKAKCNHATEVGSIIDPSTGFKIDKDYPDVEKILPTDEPLLTFELNVKHALDAFKALQQVGTVPLAPGDKRERKSSVILQLSIEEGKAVVSTLDRVVTAAYKLDVPITADPFKVRFNANYMVQALELFKDVGFLDSIEWNFYNKSTPTFFTLTLGDVLTVLICLVRL